MIELVDILTAESDAFAGWWPDHDVSGFETRLRRFQHPAAGELTFEYQQLTPAEWPGLRVVAQLPVPGDDSAEQGRPEPDFCIRHEDVGERQQRPDQSERDEFE